MVLVGFVDFLYELFFVLEFWIYSLFFDVVQYIEMFCGGYFVVFGEFEIFSNDVIQFVEKVEKCIEVLKEVLSYGLY